MYNIYYVIFQIHYVTRNQFPLCLSSLKQ